MKPTLSLAFVLVMVIIGVFLQGPDVKADKAQKVRFIKTLLGQINQDNVKIVKFHKDWNSQLNGVLTDQILNTGTDAQLDTVQSVLTVIRDGLAKSAIQPLLEPTTALKYTKLSLQKVTSLESAVMKAMRDGLP